MAEIKIATNSVIDMRLNSIFVRSEETNLLFALMAFCISDDTGACILPSDLKFSLMSGGINFSAIKAVTIAEALSGSSA